MELQFLFGCRKICMGGDQQWRMSAGEGEILVPQLRMKNFFRIVEDPRDVGGGRHAEAQPEPQRPFAEYLGRPGADENFRFRLSIGPAQQGSRVSELEIDEA